MGPDSTPPFHAGIVGYTRDRRHDLVEFRTKMQAWIPHNSLWYWGLEALICLRAAQGGGPGKSGPSAGRGGNSSSRSRTQAAPFKPSALLDRSDWSLKGAVSSVVEVIALACPRGQDAGPPTLPPALEGLPKSLLPADFRVADPDRTQTAADAGDGEGTDDGGAAKKKKKPRKPKKRGADTQEGPASGGRRTVRRKTASQRARPETAAEARRLRKLAVEPTLFIDLVGHAVSAVPAPDAAEGSEVRRVHFNVSTDWTLAPPSQDDREEQSLKHIACIVHMHDMFLRASDAARRREIVALLDRFGLDGPRREALVEDVERRIAAVRTSIL